MFESAVVEEACSDYRRYFEAILKPAMLSLEADIEARCSTLHGVFGVNMFVAHAVDYIQAIREADGAKQSRRDSFVSSIGCSE